MYRISRILSFKGLAVHKTAADLHCNSKVLPFLYVSFSFVNLSFKCRRLLHLCMFSARVQKMWNVYVHN